MVASFKRSAGIGRGTVVTFDFSKPIYSSNPDVGNLYCKSTVLRR